MHNLKSFLSKMRDIFLDNPKTVSNNLFYYSSSISLYIFEEQNYKKHKNFQANRMHLVVRVDS